MKLKKKIYFNEKIKGYGLEDIEWAHRLKKRKFKLFLCEAKVDHQETSQNISAYVIKWYMLSRDAMPSLLKNNQIEMNGKIFNYEKIFKNIIFEKFIKFLNKILFTPLSIFLKFLLFKNDKNKNFFIIYLYTILIMLYYLRGACDRNKFILNKSNWYESGYK